MVWWYCGIYKNREANSQPNALVAFREVVDDDYLSDEVMLRRVPLTALGQIRVGSVWKNGECQSEAILNIERFNVNFTKAHWRLTSFYEAAKAGTQPPYPSDIHRLKYERDQNWLLEFALPTGGKLVVPCLEFFTRCYGRSAELRRVLATYSWGDCCNTRLFAPLNETEEEDQGLWKVRLRKRLVNADVILLAHAKYDRYSEEAVKSIYSQIEANFKPDSTAPIFIKITPWFQGPAALKVKGVWFDGGKSFLGLQIDGCSQPDGNPILLGRENSNDADQLSADAELGTAWAGMPERKLVKPPEIIDLTGDLEPDSQAISAEIEDTDFEEMGKPRVVIKMKPDLAKSSAGPKTKGTDASMFSSGEAHGSGQGVGYASISAKPVAETYGMLLDMWNAMQFLKEKYPHSIESVEYYTFSDGYKTGIEPKLIGLEPFSEDDEVNSTTRKWPYIDIKTCQEIRGILVARIVANGRHIHVIEIQRRPQKKKDKNGNAEDAEENYKGLAFVLDNQREFGRWLRLLLSEIRLVRGVVQKLLEKCPGRAATFKHSAAGSDEVPCEAAVLNALDKMGIGVTTNNGVGV